MENFIFYATKPQNDPIIQMILMSVMIVMSCINQLLSITHEIFTSFDNGLEVTSVFVEISKAFDKFWHEGFIFKLKQNGISVELLHILSNFSSNRK